MIKRNYMKIYTYKIQRAIFQEHNGSSPAVCTPRTELQNTQSQTRANSRRVMHVYRTDTSKEKP